MKKVLLLGARGILGSYIQRLFSKLVPEVLLIPASRSIEQNDGSARKIDLNNPKTFSEALQDIDLVLNAVGPFEYDPTPLLNSCKYCSYLDISEVPLFIKRVQSFSEQIKASPQQYWMSGCSTIPGLIQAFAQKWKAHPEVDSLRIFLSLGSRKPVSVTLLYCLLRPLGQKAVSQKEEPSLRYYRKLIRQSYPDLSPRYFGRYPASFEKEGLKIGFRTYPSSFYVGMDTFFHGLALQMGSYIMPVFSNKALIKLSKIVQWFTPLITRLGKDLGLMTLEAYNQKGEKIDFIEVRAPKGGLNIPALPIVWTSRRLLLEPELLPKSKGYLEMEDLFSPEELAVLLEKEGFQVLGIPKDSSQNQKETRP